MVFGLFGSVAHELHFCVCAGYRLLICYGPLPMFFFTASKLQFRHRVEGLRTHRFWLARARLVVAFDFSDPLPAVFRTQPRSEGAGHKKCFMDSKGDGKHFFWLVFLACLSSACCGVWPFRIRCPRASFLCLCRL